VVYTHMQLLTAGFGNYAVFDWPAELAAPAAHSVRCYDREAMRSCETVTCIK